MTDESLKAMGLKAGEIARLKVEVAKDEKKKKVVDLIEQIRLKNVKKGNARKFKGQRVTHPVAKKQHCKVNIGWLHSENGQTFKQVRLQDGGGTRILDFPSSDLVTVDSIKQRSLKVFAKGIAKFLSADSVIASVCNFNREEIDDFKTIDGETCDFTEYLKSHGLYASKIKLYLLTQPNLSLLDNRKDTSMTESDERVEQTKKVTEASATCTLSDMPSIVHLLWGPICHHTRRWTIYTCYEVRYAIHTGRWTIYTCYEVQCAIHTRRWTIYTCYEVQCAIHTRRWTIYTCYEVRYAIHTGRWTINTKYLTPYLM
ncbi:uncharacterized protein [Ptychodera flava]|uniref:uncharacterized protein n=1 Tax=Ptychodera flava TaxID=63121 RepID=UPI00396A4530